MPREVIAPRVTPPRAVFVREHHAVASAAVPTRPAVERLDASPVEKLFMTDSVETQPVEFSDKIEVVSVAGLLGEAIRRIARRESISVLFS